MIERIDTNTQYVDSREVTMPPFRSAFFAKKKPIIMEN